jgi:hypothetical protein
LLYAFSDKSRRFHGSLCGLYHSSPSHPPRICGYYTAPKRLVVRPCPFLARSGTRNLPHVRFAVERFSADFRQCGTASRPR